MDAAALESCAADVKALYRTYDHFEWWVDRLWVMEFLGDQMFGHGDALHAEHHIARLRDSNRIGYHGYII